MILQSSLLQKILNEGVSLGADFAEVFSEHTYSSRMTMADSKATEMSTGRLYGAGIRLFFGCEEVYTFTNDLSEASLLKKVREAATAFQQKSTIKTKPLVAQPFDSIHKYKVFPWQVSKDKKIADLFRADRAARQAHSSVSQVHVSLSETVQSVQIANSDGLLTEETRSYPVFSCDIVAEENGEKDAGHFRAAGNSGCEFFAAIDIEGLCQVTTKQALQSLRADFAPAGDMPVVIDNGFGGVIFHEACGHGLETTAVAKNASVFCGLLNQKIAHESVTAIDDGTLPDYRGSLMIDDEGMPTQKTVLIENGILRSYLVDAMGSRKTGYARTGSARRQNYRFSPTSRMRNTFIAAGNTKLEDMISQVDYGLYAKEMGGGSVTPGTGAFNFSVREAFLIKNGRIDRPVKGASLIGKGNETLQRIVAVGDNLKLAPGTCGSISGMVPVTVGQPPLLVSQLTVGGRS